MSRITPKPLSSYPWYIRILFRFQTKKYGAPLEPVLLWGRTPKVFLGFLLMLKALNRKGSPLDASLRALITTKISQINECAFCIDMNAALFLERGGSEEKIFSLSKYRQSTVYSEREKTSLEYAEAMTISSEKVSDQLFSRLKVHFNEDAIIELTALIAYQNLSSKFNSALKAEAFGFCKR